MVNYFTIKTQKCACCTFMAPMSPPTSNVDPLSKRGSVKSCVPMCPSVSQGISAWLIIVWCEPQQPTNTHQWHCSVVKTGAMCMHQCLLLLFSCSHLLQQFFSPYITLSSWEEWACAFSGNPSSPNLPNYWIINLSCHSSCQVSHCLAAQFCFVWFAEAK